MSNENEPTAVNAAQTVETSALLEDENPIDITLVLLHQYPQIETWLKSTEYNSKVRTSKIQSLQFLTSLIQTQPQFEQLIKSVIQQLKERKSNNNNSETTQIEKEYKIIGNKRLRGESESDDEIPAKKRVKSDGSDNDIDNQVEAALDEFNSLKQRQQIEMEILEQKMETLKKKHKNELKEATDKIKLLIKETDKEFVICEICCSDEYSINECASCNLNICYECGNNCQQEDCEGIYCDECKDDMVTVECGKIICDCCTDSHYRDCYCWKY